MGFDDIKILFQKIDINFNSYIEKFELEQFKAENPTIPLNGIKEGMFIGDPMDGLQVERTTESKPDIPQNNDKIEYHLESAAPVKTVDSFEELEEGNFRFLKSARNTDISALNLDKDKLLSLSIDSRTIMSDSQNRIVSEVTEKMKDPGLGIKTLHKNGFTGKGVNIAIIDSPLSFNKEFDDNVISYTNLIDDNNASSYHGNTVTSRAVGKECGVAPDANLSYFTADSCENYIDAISQIIEQNKQLKKQGKPPISVISISCGFDGYDNYENKKEELFAVIELAKSEGIAVITNNPEIEPQRCPIGRNPDSDINNSANYTLWRYWNQDDTMRTIYSDRLNAANGDILLIPGENCTVADENGSYRYEGNNGGESWTVPYLAGVYALAKQANPQITYDEFYQIALDTADKGFDTDGKTYIGKIINPNKIIETCLSLSNKE